MKSLNLKKVAAVTAGVALVAASVTAAVNWSDLVNTADHTMKVNGLVVGDSAAVEDSQSAVLLAYELAKKAVYNVPTEVTEDVETCVPGSAFEGKTKKYDSVALGSATNGVVTYTNLGSDVLLYESALTYKVGGATHEASAKESLGFSVTPIFDTKNDVKRLNAEMAGGDLNYTVDFGTGVDFNADSDFTTSTWTDSGASDKVELPFLGKTYVVHKVILSGTAIQQLELFEKNAIKTYTKGDKIDGLKGKDGKTYYVMIEGITTGLDAVMTLYDATTGAVVEDYQSEKIGTSDKFAEDVLESVLEVTDIYNIGTTDVPDYKLEMAVGTEAVTVYEGKGYPYDSTKTATSDYDWYVSSITDSAAGKLLTITMKNTSKYDFKNSDGLATGETVEFPGGLAALKFVGLQLPEFNPTNPVEVYDIQFGAEVADGVGKGIIYKDTHETTHEVPFYYEFDLDDADSSDALVSGYTNAYKVDSFEFDGKTYSLKVGSASDENTFVYLQEGSYAASNTTNSDETTILDLNQDQAVLYDVFTQTSGKNLQIANSEEANISYAIGLDLSNQKLWLLLDASTTELATKTGNVTFVGTDLNNESTTISTGATFYAPHDDGDFQTLIGDESAASQTVDFNTGSMNVVPYMFDTTRASLAKFTVDLATSGQEDKVTVLIDTATNAAIAYGASSDTSSAIPGGYQVADAYSTTLYLKKGANNGLETFYDGYGTKASIDADDVVTLSIPDQIAYTEFQVIGKGGTAAETCTTASTTHTKDVATVYTGLPFTPIKASEASATGKYVVVGGYMVNSLFPAEAEVATLLGAPLAAEGDKVAAVANGNVYVAGYTKEDTAAAVNEVIALLDSTPM